MKTWSLALREIHKMRVLESRMPKKILGPERIKKRMEKIAE
jgi:hypothetical protein